MTAFITILGTGTDIGKTYLTTRLIQHGRALGHAVQALKPVLSGWSVATAATSDIGLISSALGMPQSEDSYHRLCGWRLPEPLGADLAAQKAGVELTLDKVVKWCQRQSTASSAEMMLVETAGGIMSPLDSVHTQIDMAVALGRHAILIGGNYLGGISHLLSAYAVAEARGLTLRALVVNSVGEHRVDLDLCMASLRNHVRTVPIYGITRDSQDLAALWQATSRA
jgi:dethiobiotin synthetase